MSTLTQDLIAIIGIYKESIKLSLSALSKSWQIIPATILAYFALILISQLVSGLGMAGGFITGLFYIAFLTFFYSWIKKAVNNESLRLNSLTEFEWPLFSAIMSIGFILWILDMVVGPFGKTSETAWIAACFSLGLFIVLNAIPEIIYIRNYESIPALKYSFNFIKDNWIEWFLPMLALLAPLVISRPFSFLATLSGINPFSAGADPLLPARFIFTQLSIIIAPSLGNLGIIVAIVVTIWFMLFRGILFTKLDGSSRRQRTYKSKFS
jgi:hypothetical protein